jgi:hypothetical protein
MTVEFEHRFVLQIAMSFGEPPIVTKRVAGLQGYIEL